jgi:hypothetical protein
MARKKKQKQQENNNMQISYKGDVSVVAVSATTGKVKKRYQSHNKGSSQFFELLVQCIVGDTKAPLSMPKYIRGYASDNTPTTSSFIAYNNPIITRTETTASVTLEFLIPFSQLITTKSTTKLRLFNSTSSSALPLAEVDVTEFTGSVDTNYLIVWKMTIGNNL